MMTSWDHLINIEMQSVATTRLTITVDIFFSGIVDIILLLVVDQNYVEEKMFTHH